MTVYSTNAKNTILTRLAVPVWLTNLICQDLYYLLVIKNVQGNDIIMRICTPESPLIHEYVHAISTN